MEKKQRVPKGEKYWCISRVPEGEIREHIEQGDSIDELCYTNNNYFHTKEEAESMVHKLRAVLKGANVIEDLTESDIIKAKSDFDIHAKYLEEKGLGYTNIKEARSAFLVGIQWRNSKIVK